MKIFITGASGFVGGAIAQTLKEHHECLGMARSKASMDKVRDLGITPIPCSLNAVKADHLKGVDCVIHCAARAESWGRYQQFWETNVKGTQQLLDAAVEAGVKRFIHLSTAECLLDGKTDLIDVDESYPYPKNSPLHYVKTKQEAEKVVLRYQQDSILDVLILRPRLVWGPNDQTILPEIEEMIKSKTFRWIDGGRHQTVTTHIQNLVHAVDLALTKGIGGSVYFIVDPVPHTFKTFFTELLHTHGIHPNVGNAPSKLLMPLAAVVEKVWSIFRKNRRPPLTKLAIAIPAANYTVDYTKAKKELDYMPIISMEEGMEQLKSAYKN